MRVSYLKISLKVRGIYLNNFGDGNQNGDVIITIAINFIFIKLHNARSNIDTGHLMKGNDLVNMVTGNNSSLLVIKSMRA